jgi:AraC family transcriptional regulator of adaptative response/methylated-DNA-[protein]-cysteine methyltransferase
MVLMSGKTQFAESGGPVDKVRAHIEAHHDRPVSLAELGRLVHLSPFTVQRLFKQALGVSPLQYQRALRAASLRGALKQGESVTSAIYNAGFGSSSRGYDGAQLGMTPARFAAGGRGERIGWCSARSPFGWVIVGATERGLCWLSLAGTRAEAEASLRAEFPAAELRRDPALAEHGGCGDASGLWPNKLIRKVCRAAGSYLQRNETQASG